MAPVGSVGVVKVPAASKLNSGDLAGVFPCSFCRALSEVAGRPFPGTILLIPRFRGFTTLFFLIGGINLSLESEGELIPCTESTKTAFEISLCCAETERKINKKEKYNSCLIFSIIHTINAFLISSKNRH